MNGPCTAFPAAVPGAAERRPRTRTRTARGRRRIAGAVLALHAMAAGAQTTVYESKDKSGPVFSDRPTSGAAVVDLPPPNVVQMPKVDPVAPPSAAPAPAYRSLDITAPVSQGTIHSNTGEFTVSVRSVPGLRAGDSLRMSLDGQLLSTRYRSTTLKVSATDWQRAARSDNVEHRVQLVIVDAQDKVLIQSAPVVFYVQRAAVGGKR